MMPTEEESLRALVAEITTRTPPLHNLYFTNWYAASFLCGTILDRAADAESLALMGEMWVEEATNRVGALLARVRRQGYIYYVCSPVCFLCIKSFLLGKFPPLSFIFQDLVPRRRLSELQPTRSGGQLTSCAWPLWSLSCGSSLLSGAG